MKAEGFVLWQKTATQFQTYRVRERKRCGLKSYDLCLCGEESQFVECLVPRKNPLESIQKIRRICELWGKKEISLRVDFTWNRWKRMKVTRGRGDWGGGGGGDWGGKGKEERERREVGWVIGVIQLNWGWGDSIELGEGDLREGRKCQERERSKDKTKTKGSSGQQPAASS